MSQHSGKGFTLVEAMITVAILAILAAVAVPSYSDYLRRGRISQATNALSGMRVKLEQYFQDHRTYAGACTEGTVADLPRSDDFAYSCPTLSATAFLVQATGLAGGPMNGFSYTIDQDNARATTALPEGWGSAPVACWVVRKGGQC